MRKPSPLSWVELSELLVVIVTAIGRGEAWRCCYHAVPTDCQTAVASCRTRKLRSDKPELRTVASELIQLSREGR